MMGGRMRSSVVVVGAGPAAAGAVGALRRAGVEDIVVLEREQAAGGAARHCGHGGYGLREFAQPMTGPRYADALAGLLGPYLRLGHTVRRLLPGGNIELIGAHGSEVMSAGAVLLATGARETSAAARLIPSARPPGVMSTGALQQFVYLHGKRPAQRVVVLGTELVAYSALLTCRHAGISVAALLEPGGRSIAGPGHLPPLIARYGFAAPVRLHTRLVEILGADRITGVVVERDGRRETIACDGVIVSGGFLPEAPLLSAAGLALDPGSRGPVVDEFGRCSDPAYFAAGNLVHPVETAGACFRAGARTGRAIAEHLAGRLPVPDAARSIEVGGAMKYLYPQRIAGHGPVTLVGRVREQRRGALKLFLDGRLIGSRRGLFLPERRIRIPLPRRRFAEAQVVVE